jgi:hypothetical protein
MIHRKKANNCEIRTTAQRNGEILDSVLASHGSNFPDATTGYRSRLFGFS